MIDIASFIPLLYEFFSLLDNFLKSSRPYKKHESISPTRGSISLGMAISTINKLEVFRSSKSSLFRINSLDPVEVKIMSTSFKNVRYFQILLACN